MKSAQLIVALAIFASTPAAFAKGSGGTSRPVCWIAGRNAMRAIDLRNHGSTREEARRALYISALGQEGNTPEWIVLDIIDPRLRAVYETPASGKVDPSSQARSAGPR